MLDPQAQALLKLMSDNGFVPIQTLTASEARKAYEVRRKLTQAPPEAVAVISNHSIESEAATITLRSYRPIDSTISENLPALIYFHGGGWTVGDLDSHDVLCRSLSNRSKCMVVAVNYRLAPENPFPAAYIDSLNAFRWVAANANKLGVDASRMAVGGDSAGGNLAAAACIALREEATRPKFQLLIYPAVDLQAQTPSYFQNATGYGLTRDAMIWYTSNYINDPAHITDWRASPILAQNLQGLPPALVITAGFDPLCDDGLNYADALSNAGCKVEYVNFSRQIHGFITMGGLIDETKTAVNLCAQSLKQALSIK